MLRAVINLESHEYDEWHSGKNRHHSMDSIFLM